MLPIKVLFALKVVPGYLVSGLRKLPAEVSVTIISIPKDRHPSTDYFPPNVREINRRSVFVVDDVLAALDGKMPDIFVCCGWVDKLYLALAEYLHKKGCQTVIAIDTPWRGDLRQKVNCLIWRLIRIKNFEYGWGAGIPQSKYLKRLGFQEGRVKTGYYSADTDKFNEVYIQRKRNSFTHTFVYVGRYVKEKNIQRMETAFLSAIGECRKYDWNLLCIGGGKLWNSRTIHPRIEHVGYKSPSEIQNYIRNCGCFILPSVYEPWGVVVHEFAVAGFPILCSDRVQSATVYLQEGKNGYLFDPLDENAIKAAFMKIMGKSDSELHNMGEMSHMLGMGYTTNDWVQRLLSFKKGGV